MDIGPRRCRSCSKNALIAHRRQGALEYREYLRMIIELAKRVKKGPGSESYPMALDTPARRALYDNLEKDEALPLAVDAAVLDQRQDGWRSNPFKLKRVKLAIRAALQGRGQRRRARTCPAPLVS